MEINSKKRVVTTQDELLNHEGWKEHIESRYKLKEHGNRIFRTFELDCGSDYHISIRICEAINLSFTTLRTSKPFVTTVFQTRYMKYGSRGTDIADCKDREAFYWKLYQTLDKKFPLTDFDVQSTKVWY